MFQTIGLDEAGYGPNLGPLVIGATRWELPNDPHDCDMWALLGDVICDRYDRKSDRLLIADSKHVYSPQRGVSRLELAVLSILRTMGIEPDTLRELWLQLAAPDCSAPDEEPWFVNHPIKLPVAASREAILAMTKRLQDSFAATGIFPRDIRLDLMLGQRFNKLIQDGGKGVCLSRATMNVLNAVWDANDDSIRTLVVGDKHGGRNRYADLLAEILDGRMLFTLEETDAKSRYRVGTTSLIFRSKAEACLPVALASMCAKYVRELSMMAFNKFWQQHIDDLKPTKGYPQDARRFRKDIELTQKQLGISDDMLWRAK